VSPAGESSLQRLAQDARAAGRIAVDTEFMGEGRYRTLLCLVQAAVPAGGGAEDHVQLIDPLAELDGAPLAAVLADPAVRVVVHAGRQDIALLRRRYGARVSNIFDTQVAAGFVGLGAQSSYDSLLSELLGLRVAKGASFTRWDARPLSQEQLAYARADVEHLLELAAELERRLREQGRLQWALEECQPLEGASDERDLETVFSRLPRVGGLGPAARPVARELVRWREETAARQDRPVQSILSDAALVEVARRKPSSRSELERIRGIGAAGARQRAQQVLAVVADARRLPPEDAARAPRPPAPRPEDAPLVALCEALLRTRALQAGLAYELLATRGELQALVAAWRAADEGALPAEGAQPDDAARVMRGWRRELAGGELLELLRGCISLAVDAGEREVRVGPRADANR